MRVSFWLLVAGCWLLVAGSGFGASTTQFGVLYNYGSGTAKQALPSTITVDTNTAGINVPGPVKSGTGSTNTSGEVQMTVTNQTYNLTLTSDASSVLGDYRLFLGFGAGLWAETTSGTTNGTVGRIAVANVMSPSFTALTDGATITATCSSTKAQQNFAVTLGGNRTLAFSGATAGMGGLLLLKQDGTGGRTLTPPSPAVVFPGGGSTLALTPTASALDAIAWQFDGTNYYFAGAFVQDVSSAASPTFAGLTLNGHLTMADAKNIIVNATTGTKIGTATTQKLGFFNATPIVQEASTTDLRQLLIDFGFLATGGATPLNLNAGALTAGLATFNDNVTIADAKNFILNATTGTKFGTATSQKLGFYNATPVVQPTSTTDLRTALINLGLYATGGASPLDLNGGALTVGSETLNGTLTIADAVNIVLNATTGTKFGTATSQKLGFFNATPVVQPTSTTDLRTALINLGLYASGGASPLDLNLGTLTTPLHSMGAASATAVSGTVAGQAGTGTDKVGGAVILDGGQGTGTGRGGGLVGRTAPSGSTGSGANALSERYHHAAKAVTLTESSATTVATIAVATGTVLGGQCVVTIKANDATDFQSRTLRFTFAAVNKAGTVTAGIDTPSEAVAVSTGTLTATITAVANGSAVDLKVNAVSSLTQTTLNCLVSLPTLSGDGTAAVTEI